MSASNYNENVMLDAAFPGNTGYIKLHTGDPGEDGTANASTETTRKQVTWAAASGGSKAATGSPVAEWTNLGISGQETFTHWSAWSASTAGNCLWTGPLNQSATMNPGETFRLTSLTATLD